MNPIEYIKAKKQIFRIKKQIFSLGKDISLEVFTNQLEWHRKCRLNNLDFNSIPSVAATFHMVAEAIHQKWTEYESLDKEVHVIKGK